MIFNSIDFLIFALLFFLLWPLFNKQNNLRWAFITVTSFVFYGWWDWRFLFLILGSGLIDYACGLAIQKSNTQRRRRVFLILSLVGNLGALCVFKYSTFFAEILDDCFGFFGVATTFVEQLPDFTLILPVGISFYTFQSLSYTIDIYRGRLKPVNNILHFFSYLAMFPQLVAGPIIRAKDMLKQLVEYRKVTTIERWHAIKLIAFGFFQKVVIADNLSYFIDSAFEGKTPYTGSLFWWFVVVAFAFQIYCDFSGYSLIAKGLAKTMGLHLKMNFNHPYLSSSLREFWSRWHISLSTWFRDYVYIPLGGSRKGVWKGVLFLSITMLVSGLWHGAKYTFIIWGAIHAILLAIERLTGWTKKLKIPWLRYFMIAAIFMQVCIGWVYFRADEMGQANGIVKMLFSFKSSGSGFLDYYHDNIVFLYLALGIEAVILLRRTYSPVNVLYRRSNLDLILVPLAIVMAIYFRGEGAQFIYFQF